MVTRFGWKSEMDFKLGWLVEQKVLLSRPSGIITTLDVVSINRRLFECLYQFDTPVDQPIYIFSDVSALKEFRGSVLDLKNLLTVISHPNLGWHVVSGIQNPLILYASIFLGKVGHFPTFVANTPQQGLEFLMKQDPTLPNLISRYRYVDL